MNRRSGKGRDRIPGSRFFLILFGMGVLWGGLFSAEGLRAQYYTFPTALELCGEPVPLQDRRIWERMDREFMLNVYDRAQVYLWLKRSRRYFPFIEGRLQENGLPDDLKYLMVAESALRPHALSNKGAAGFWQFMERTGRRFNLQKKPWIDERLDLAKSTEAAIQYLKWLYELFGKWSLAMAAYNCGEERLKEEITQQGENDFYRLALPQETERFLFRILSAKVILSHPEQYGFFLPPEEAYEVIETETVTLNLPQTIHLREIAKACGSFFKELKELNPELQGYTLPAGVHRLKIPPGRKTFLENHPLFKDYVKPTP